MQTLDGSAVVLRVWRDAAVGWENAPVSRLTADTLEVLRDDGVRIVRLRRHHHVGEVSLAWFPAQPHVDPTTTASVQSTARAVERAGR